MMNFAAFPKKSLAKGKSNSGKNVIVSLYRHSKWLNLFFECNIRLKMKMVMPIPIKERQVYLNKSDEFWKFVYIFILSSTTLLYTSKFLSKRNIPVEIEIKIKMKKEKKIALIFSCPIIEVFIRS